MPKDRTAAEIREVDRRIFNIWDATASIGAKLAYWKRRAKEVVPADGAARRWEITVLIGPCTDREAEELMEDVADFVYGHYKNLDACVGMRLDEEAESVG